MAKRKKRGGKPQVETLSTNLSKDNNPQEKSPVDVSGQDKKRLSQKRRTRLRKGKETRPRPIRQRASNVDKMPGLIDKYGMAESRRRIEQRGFHPKVTTKTLGEVLAAWKEQMARDNVRSSAEEFLKMGHGLDQTGLRGFLFKDDAPFEVISGRKVVDRLTSDADDHNLKTLLKHPGVGPEVLKRVFESGRKTAMNLALTSPDMWDIVSSNVRIWDAIAGRIAQAGFQEVFVAVGPVYTVGEVLKVRMDYPFRIPLQMAKKGCGDRHPAQWKEGAISREYEFIRLISQHKDSIMDTLGIEDSPSGEVVPLAPGDKGPSPKKAVPEALVNKYGPSVHQVFMRMKPIDKTLGGFGRGSQFSNLLTWRMPYQPAMIANLRHLREMMTQISQQCNAHTVLHFHNVPLFDRRVLAIILRACPNVQMVGVYECPMIHFGDVIAILDLIHEINIVRREANRPEIKSFDFYPNFSTGMQYQHPNAATYGLTWAPYNREMIQRGFFQIILEAFLKAKSMKLSLLFSKTGSFLDFIYRVPNTPFAVPGFLDAVYRYFDLDEKSEDFVSDKKKVIYDLLKPVRSALDDVSRDWYQWYMFEMGERQFFCASCGYDTFQEFFMSSPIHVSRRRICGKCCLRKVLDFDATQQMPRNADILKTLFLDWNPLEFNLDAPIAKEGEGLMHLRTTESVRPPPPNMFINADGDLQVPRHKESLVRDEKLHSDSLQHLPTLHDLTGDKMSEGVWDTAWREATQLDIAQRVTSEYLWQKLQKKGTSKIPRPFPITANGNVKFQGHPLAVQPHNEEASLGFSEVTAMEAYQRLLSKGW